MGGRELRGVGGEQGGGDEGSGRRTGGGEGKGMRGVSGEQACG